jgi:hypothetical protein
MRLADTMIIAAATVGAASAHMSLVVPFSRNAVDKADPRWLKNKWWPYAPTCAPSDSKTSGVRQP